MNEQEIINKVKNGDTKSFSSIVDLYKKKIISLCYSYTSDFHEAEDLSQEVFICLYKNLCKFKWQCSLSTYIYKITINKCIDYKRKKTIKNFLGGLFIKAEKSSNMDFDDKEYIRHCILTLRGELKTPLILHYYLDLNYNEIGNILNISSKAVEGRIYRAKCKLKSKFEKEGFINYAKAIEQYR